MKSMFRPIKKIFTYIQKNASNGTMFGNTSSVNGAIEGVSASGGGARSEPPKELVLEQQLQSLEQASDQQLDDDDIERQIKTSIIDASKVHAAKTKIVLPLQLQLDDELADFAHEPVTLADEDDDELDEQFLELENFPNNEIIVLSDNELNSSLASDNVSEDPLAIDDFTQPLLREEDNEEEEEAAESSGDLLWLKLDTSASEATGSSRSLIVPAPGCSSSAAAAVKPPTKTKEEELRSDGGSDSGLGSENDRHNTIGTTATTTSVPKPLRSNLKRRLDDDAMELALGPDMSSGVSCCSSTQKRSKRCINFDSVKVYYFPRQQGFSCVPTAGGCTLGMGARHIAFKTMTLAEHAAELRRAHRNQNQEQQQLQVRGSSSDDSEESEEDYLSEGSGSDADDGSNGFLQPVTPKQRRALLKAAGVRKIDASEKIDCRDIRNSREVCGCSCREFCDPETCACSQAGIKCQVDRAMFPCGCTREACGNTVGRVEFNPTRVRTHYIHTVMRLDMEQRQSQGPPNANSGNGLVYGSSASGSSSPGVAAVAAAAAASHCFFMQPQSNYSSGYASPAYTPETSVSYYQQQQTPQSTAAPGSNSGTAQQSSYAASYPQLDSLDSGLFASGSNATPSYGELLTPTYHQTLSYGSSQLNPYNAYQQTTTSSGGIVSAGAYSSCAVPSVPPFGNATTTASNATQYQHANALETTAASLNTSSSSISITASSCATGLARLSSGNGPVDFISLNAPIGSSSRISQINDLLQHNRNTTVALVAVSESYTSVRNSSSSSSSGNSSSSGATNPTSTIDSIDTPPIVEETQRSCMTFEELPPPLINPTPIVAVVEQHQQQQQRHKQMLAVSTTPQSRQPLAASASVAESLSSSSN
ncbi:uncharacterized protein LOC115760228 [Drosophila novamexicana]|uniref:uncharacterized protein LOC115760228 n=1 Tax=Drosophila novamexicana TaxID=47314 RepID=UPI0011E5E678|nr:uncharacterized protein LOC115760228 [Drosophila novamexicana]